MEVFKRARFDKILEKATDENLDDPDVGSALFLCDLIRGQEISAKNAVQCVKKRLQHENTSVVLHTIYILESMMKNCGNAVHEEVATADFMHSFAELAAKSPDVRTKVLTCIHNWSYVFRGNPNFSAVQDVYDNLKNEGYTFPPFSENDAMFSVACAPSWKEETSCHRCKVAFSAFRRRHHCRNCGNSFCSECSSKQTVLPQFGIEKEVRVCEYCFTQLTNGPSQNKKPQPPSEEQDRERQRKERELATLEAEELELALALSASEAESKERERRVTHSNNLKSTTSSATHDKMEESNRLQLLPVLDTTDMDPDLARYLNRHYWENRASAMNTTTTTHGASGTHANYDISRASPLPEPSAPIYATLPQSVTSEVKNAIKTSDSCVKSGNTITAQANVSKCPTTSDTQTSEKSKEEEEFLSALRGSIEFFVNRMQSNRQRGRSIAYDTSVQTLFHTLHQMHPQLLQYKKSVEDNRAYLESLQDKLTQLRDAREALDALRHEHATRRQLEEQEAACRRQFQMMQKLELMRQQKRETLEYRRRMALEQTMQYQQQYQPQALPQQIDPTTGLPVSSAAPFSNIYAVAPIPYQQNLAPSQSHYAPPGSYIGTAPTRDPSGSSQPAMEHIPSYYPTAQVPQSYPYGSLYMQNLSQQQQQHTQPVTYGPYSMQHLEATLPSSTDHPNVYRPQPPSSVMEYAEDSSHFPTTLLEMHQSTHPDVRSVSPSQATHNTASSHRPPVAIKTEEQLITFD